MTRIVGNGNSDWCPWMATKNANKWENVNMHLVNELTTFTCLRDVATNLINTAYHVIHSWQQIAAQSSHASDVCCRTTAGITQCLFHHLWQGVVLFLNKAQAQISRYEANWMAAPVRWQFLPTVWFSSLVVERRTGDREVMVWVSPNMMSSKVSK